VAEMPVEDIIPNYSEVIREARERLGLSQEELARKIKEKVSLIRKIERGELTPEEKVARKLEKELGIKLMERIESPKIEKKELPSTLTLGDVVVVRRKGE
ncbi:MAG: TIGR00270 family protein, partial [Archaeoglobi archaeon]|nr:TIGR00270 family protein [Candidatus Mnemosynella bozhongmuii]